MHRFLSPQRRPWLPFLILLALSALVVVFSPPRTERPSRRAEDVLRIGAPEPVRQATVISPYGPGVEFELFSRFNREAPCTPEWVNVANREQGFAMLRRGEIDLLVGFWGDEPGGDDAGSLSGGRAYAHFTPVSITGAAARPPAEASGVLKDLERTFSSFIPAFSASGQSGPSGEPSGDPSGVPPGERPPFPVFSPLTDGEGYPEKDGILMDPASSALWLPFMGDVDIKQASGQTPYRWFWRADGSALARRLEAFWQHEDRQAELAELTERYFGFLPRTLRQTDILELADTLAQRLPEYETFIMNAAKETGVPPLLL
ncbi:MAG: hypothetical protein LBV01_03970, partial [Deltaproteobacteria bacterium]|nr:hypothetical protein [Deltaproteobacteria bacterium]